MNRPERLFATVLVVVVVMALLFWSAGFYRALDRSAVPLHVEKPQTQTLVLGDDVTLDLEGRGFDQETRAHLVMDISNDDIIVNRYPVTGYFNVSLASDDLLFLGSNNGLKVLSIADRRSPRLLDEYLDGRPVLGLHLSGNYLYAACGRYGVVIMEITGTELTYVTDIQVADLVTASFYYYGYLFVATNTQRLLVYDLTQIKNPTLTKQLVFDAPIRDLAMYDAYLYVLTRNDEIRVFKHVLAGPLLDIATFSFPDRVHKILVYNSALFVAMDEGLFLYSLEQPYQPRLVRRWDQFNALVTLQAGETALFAIDGYLSFRILDADQLQLSESIQLPGGLRTIVETEDYLYVTGSEEGLLTIAKDRFQPRQIVRNVEVPSSSIRSAVFVDDRIFLSGTSGLFVIDTSQDEQPFTQVAAENSTALALIDQLLFVSQRIYPEANAEATNLIQRGTPRGVKVYGGTPQGIKVYDIRNPTEPSVVAVWPNIFLNRLAVAGRYLVATGASGLNVIDPANLDEPVIVDRLTDIQVISLVVDDSMLYLITREHGLQIYSLDNYGALTFVGQLQRPFPLNQFDAQLDVQVRNGIAYIANGQAGLLTVNVINPENPQLVGSLALPGYSKGVQLHQDQLYVISTRDGVSIVDITNNLKPRLVGHLPIARITRYLLFDDGLLYFFQDQKGVTAIPLPTPARLVQSQGEGRLHVVLPSPAHPGRYSLQISRGNELVVHYGVVEYQ